MSISTPAPAAKKRGMGCCGCGCLVFVIILLLLVGSVATVGYVAYSKMAGLTSPVAAAVPTFDGGDETYKSTQQKLSDFNHNLKNHQASTIRLSADEINTLIAHNPEFAKNHVLAFVTMTDTEASVQASLPSSLLSQGVMKDRYINGTISFGLDFDPDQKNILIDIHTITVGDKTVSTDGKTTATDSSSALNQSFIKTTFSGLINQEIKQKPEGKDFLDHTKSIRIENSQLVIESE